MFHRFLFILYGFFIGFLLVFIGCSIESIKKPMVFLGFLCFWRALGPRIIKKLLVFIGFSVESTKKPKVFLGFSCFWRASISNYNSMRYTRENAQGQPKPESHKFSIRIQLDV